MPRLLMIKTTSLGDVIHNLPVITDIHAHFPDTIIDWVVEESFADIPRLHPSVQQVIPVAIRRWRKSLLKNSTWQEIRHLRHQLSEHQYDHIIDTQGLLKSAMIGRLASGSYHGQDSASAREPLAASLYHHTHRVARNQHAVTRNRELAALALGYPMPDNAPDYGIHAGQLPGTLTLPSQYIAGLHATSRDSKLWPESQWIVLGQQLQTQGIALVLPWGNASEHARAQRIAAALSNAIVLPRLGLTALAAVLGHAVAAIGVDTGLVHLAAALDKPTIAIYTDTDPLLTGVLAHDKHKVINLGGKGQNPDTESVLDALAQVTTI
ncbi:lipopolysaccharide heptosyltransferase I [Methylobacillus gramineus]|uniref:lipopolysaccharide heptosyltransferase I n=1 Tax=Methylobacillus gramineus TaxID=755169 RepID=UPI00299DDFC5|nr:lipopolysaccharide heptosyltransferase I [Methylobacillus gramineus]